MPTGISTHSLKVPPTFEGDKYLYAGLSCLACPLTIQRPLPGVNYPYSLVLPLTLPAIHPTASLQAPAPARLVCKTSQGSLLLKSLLVSDTPLLPEWTSHLAMEIPTHPSKLSLRSPHICQKPSRTCQCLLFSMEREGMSILYVSINLGSKYQSTIKSGFIFL